MEAQLREKSLRGNQTQDIYYSEDKTSYKVVALTYPWCSSRTLHSNVSPNMNDSQLGLWSKICKHIEKS
jgi:hypothetical protein